MYYYWNNQGPAAMPVPSRKPANQVVLRFRKQTVGSLSGNHRYSESRLAVIPASALAGVLRSIQSRTQVVRRECVLADKYSSIVVLVQIFATRIWLPQAMGT